VSPDSAPILTTLDVVVNGRGFDDGAVATWSRGGVADPSQVKTNSTRFVNSKQLVANITISETAVQASWDVTVMLTGGHSGVGTESAAFKVTGKPQVWPTIPLSVTVSDVDAFGQPYKIQSDGQGPYVDGTQGVSAYLDGSGNLIFDPGAAARKSGTNRYMRFNFDSPVDPLNTYRPNPSTSENSHVATTHSAFWPKVPLQNLGVDGNPSTDCMAISVGLANARTGWRVSYHRNFEDAPATPTAFAVVTRTSISPAVWTVAPSGSCSPNSNVAALRSDDGTVLYGYYNLPFLLTLHAQ
jgi:hypothetical protein